MTDIRTANLPEHVAFEAHTALFTVKAIYRRGQEALPWTREGRKTTRVFGAMDTLAPELMKLEPFANNYGEGYVSIPLAGPERSAEDNVRSAMWAAWKREATKVAAARTVEVLVTALKPVGGDSTYALPTETPKFSFKAGCSMCPCSPGFILDVRVVHNGIPVDLWIETRAKEA